MEMVREQQEDKTRERKRKEGERGDDKKGKDGDRRRQKEEEKGRNNSSNKPCKKEVVTIGSGCLRVITQERSHLNQYSVLMSLTLNTFA